MTSGYASGDTWVSGATWQPWPASYAPPVQQGWQCPLCKTVYAPWISVCSCGKYPSTITTTVNATA